MTQREQLGLHADVPQSIVDMKETDLRLGPRWKTFTVGEIRKAWAQWQKDLWSHDTPEQNKTWREISESELPDALCVEIWHIPESSWGWLNRPQPWRVKS